MPVVCIFWASDVIFDFAKDVQKLYILLTLYCVGEMGGPSAHVSTSNVPRLVSPPWPECPNQRKVLHRAYLTDVWRRGTTNATQYKHVVEFKAKRDGRREHMITVISNKRKVTPNRYTKKN